MDSKYFVPELSDFMVGYEFEENAASIYDDTPSPTWYKRTFKEPFSQGYIIGSAIKKGFVRVPYLTKEQIEAEGWKSVDLSQGFAYRYGVPSFRFGFTKGNYFVALDTRKYHIEIGALDLLKIDFLPEFPETFRVTIPCKDINTFRYICKLLNI